MPYDPRSVEDGGNRGIDVTFSRAAPAGKFRVIGVDTFDGTDWHEADFDTREEAEAHVKKRGADMTVFYVYNDKGTFLRGAGRF